jgi:hypothetical protein
MAMLNNQSVIFHLNKKTSTPEWLYNGVNMWCDADPHPQKETPGVISEEVDWWTCEFS